MYGGGVRKVFGMSPQVEKRLWQRGVERARRRGELESEAIRLRALLTGSEARRFKAVSSQEGKTLFSGVTKFSNEIDGDTRHFQTEAHVKAGADTVMLAVHEYDHWKPKAQLVAENYYQLNPNGTVVNLDTDLHPIVTQTTADVPLIKTAIQHITQSVEQTIYRGHDRNRERLVRAGKVAGALGGVAIVGGLVFAGIKFGILDPRAAEEAQRQEYDKESHQLPGEGVRVDYSTFVTITEAQFNAIPTYGGSDTNLDNPRILEIGASNSSCATILGVEKGETVYAALPEGSVYASHGYGMTVRDDRISICLVEELGKNDDNVKVAVQVK